MQGLKQRTDVTTEIAPLLTLVQTKEVGEGQLFTIRAEQSREGWNPFEVEKNYKAEPVATEIYLTPETALRLAAQIFEHHGYRFDLQWRGQMFNPKTQRMETVAESEPEMPRSGAV